MSVNTANTPDGQGVLIFNGEVILVFGQGVVMSFEKNPNENLHGKHNGSVYLTSHRVIFMPENGKYFKSFEMPFSSMQDVHLEQPIFGTFVNGACPGANYLRGIAVAMAGSQLSGEIPWRLTFNKGGCIDFGRSLLEAVDRAEKFRPANAPPAYAPPCGDFYAAPPDYYAPSSDGHNGFLPPTHAFPDRPQSNTVFMREAPPPYPGIGPDRPPMPTEQLHRAGTTSNFV
ncbi:GRAM domain protein [Cooperia oncophora]